MNTRASDNTGFFVPWALDAASFLGESRVNRSDTRGDLQKIRNLRLIEPQGIVDFEERGALIAAGDRGTGKSLVLARKAVQLLMRAQEEKMRYLTLVERPPFVSLLAPSKIIVPVKDYRRFSSHRVWRKLWTLVLKAHFACMAVRDRNDPKQNNLQFVFKHYFDLEESHGPKDIQRQFFTLIWTSFPVQESLGPAIAFLVKHNIGNDELDQWSLRANGVITRHAGAESQQAIFVDGIDEAIGDPNGQSLFNDLRQGSAKRKEGDFGQTEATSSQPNENWEERRQLALDVLLHAQTGFILAADEIRTEFRVLTAYGVVRREAGEWALNPELSGKTADKVDGALVAMLRYKHDQLESIFNLNVDHTSDDELFDPAAEFADERLFGFHRITHSTVLGQSEPALSLLIRHTFRAPRQLVSIAKAAKEAVAKAALRPDRVNEIVNAVDRHAATRGWGDYIASLNPPWYHEHAAGLQDIHHNVLLPDEVAAIESTRTGLFNFLYSRGLIGVPIPIAARTVLDFREPNGSDTELPRDYRFVALHPILSAHLTTNKTIEERRFFYSSEFIVGHGLMCPEVLVAPKLTVACIRDNFWKLSTENGDLVLDRHLPSDESGLLAELDSTRAMHFLFLILALACKRNASNTVGIGELEKEAKLFAASQRYTLEIHHRPASDYAQTRLAVLDDVTEVALLNTALDPYGFGVSMVHSKTRADRKFSIRIRPEGPTPPQQKSHWPRLSHHVIRVWPLQRREAC